MAPSSALALRFNAKVVSALRRLDLQYLGHDFGTDEVPQEGLFLSPEVLQYLPDPGHVTLRVDDWVELERIMEL